MESVRRSSAAVLVALVALGFYWYVVWDVGTADKETVRNSQTTRGEDKGARV